MPHQIPWRSRLTRCEQTAAFLLLISAATLSMPAISRAAEPAAAAETPVGAGPLTPVRREPPAATAQSAPSQKQAPAAKKPAITMPPASTSSAESTPAAPSQSVSKPQPKAAEQATSPAPSPKTAKSQPKQTAQTTAPGPMTKAEKPQAKQAEEATPPRPHRKSPSSKTIVKTIEQAEMKAAQAERRSRSTEVVEQTQRRERVYRDAYGWPEDEPYVYRRTRPYPPPTVYGEEPGEMGPVPLAPPWSYRNRSFAWGPYPGMGGPRGPW